MEKVSVSLMAGAVNLETLTIIRALVNFIYYTQLQLHTSKTLDALDSCLKMFHAHKELLIKLEIHQHFNIPKMHAIIHYLTAIRALESTDGYNMVMSFVCPKGEKTTRNTQTAVKGFSSGKDRDHGRTSTRAKTRLHGEMNIC